MKKLLITILCATSMTAFAATEEGAYAGGNLGFGNVDSLKNLDLGINLNAGYQFNQYLALEGDYTYFSSADTWQSTPAATQTGNAMYFIGAIKGTLPLTNRFSVYGKAGIGFAYSSLSATPNFANGSTSAMSPASLLGAGLKYDITPKLAVNVEDMNYINTVQNGLGNANLIGIGASYNF